MSTESTAMMKKRNDGLNFGMTRACVVNAAAHSSDKIAHLMGDVPKADRKFLAPVDGRAREFTATVRHRLGARVQPGSHSTARRAMNHATNPGAFGVVGGKPMIVPGSHTSTAARPADGEIKVTGPTNSKGGPKNG